ncbi:conserved hypothetical protein [Hyella patelloides LEGE 07179]|uniref:Uncharacterized protein n=1 Tax=Hyella patelloides LEGE 07179 TaxID=945734 RepID=A0A563W3H4_9CYAN|nr:hypothetical protein [Hyella patelloides]VEP18241.1 conserved hypothetical protein [Hyella patelloides LEGE 07179]
MIFPVFPILMLVTTIGSIILYLRTANDIFGVLSVGMAIACLIWGLVVAHWSIHLLFLVALLLLRKPKVIAKLAASLK